MNATRSSFYLIGLLSLAVPAVLAVGCDDVTEEGAGGAGGGGGSGSGSNVIALGSVDATTYDADNEVYYGELTVTIPSGAKGVNLLAELPASAGADDLVMIDTVKRGDTVIHDYWANGGQGPQRGEPVEGIFTLQYPTSELVDYATGEHTIRVASSVEAAGVKVYGIYKTAGSTSSGTLDMNVYFAGIDGLSAATQADHAKFQEMWTEAQRLFAKGNLTIGNVNFIDVSDDSLFSVQGPSSAPGTDLGRLFSSSAPNPGKALNLFLVRLLSQDTGDPLLGISGGVPGPGEKVGTPHSGLVANGEDMVADPKLVAQIVVHESFHYLGLNHTSERGWGDGTCPGGENSFDPIPDTPECGSAQDGSLPASPTPNCSVGTGECVTAGSDNLMFWAGVDFAKLPDGTDVKVSAGQSYVLLRNPLTK